MKNINHHQFRRALPIVVVSFCLIMTLALVLFELKLAQASHNPPHVIVIPPSPTVQVVPPPGQRVEVATGINYSYSYVLFYNGQGKGQTPLFYADSSWVLHWQCHLEDGSGKFPIAVRAKSGVAQQWANVVDCRKGHTSGDSPQYAPGWYFVSVTPGKRTALWDLFVQVSA